LPRPAPEPRPKDPLWWHLLLLVGVSVAYESLFISHGINLLDEAWQLYAAMQLAAGGVLYQDVLWVFPPGHLLPAWIGYRLDPPGFILARCIYAAFNVALCVGLYLLGRRLMPPAFALLGAVLLAIAAPRSHMMQLLFGYRYLIFSVLALLCFDRRLRTGNWRWMLAAGMLTGVALCFRLTPAFAVSCGVGVGILASSRSIRRWIRDSSGFALGLLIATAPVLAWFASTVGPEALWREVVMRPVGMLQALPLPEIELPTPITRERFTIWFVAVAFRLYLALYAGYAAALGWSWIRSLRQRRPFEYPLLLAVVVWGGVYYVRSMGRSDEPHLDSALPPVCLLLGHLLSLAFRKEPEGDRAPRRRTWALAGAWFAAVAAWVFLLNTDSFLSAERRGTHPLEALDGRTSLHSSRKALKVDGQVSSIKRLTKPEDVLLDLTASPGLHVLSGRLGPGGLDVVMPGTFRDAREEREFLTRLKQSPPALAIWPNKMFDKMRSRTVARTAPRIVEWLRQNYRAIGRGRSYTFVVPRSAEPPDASDADLER